MAQMDKPARDKACICCRACWSTLLLASHSVPCCFASCCCLLLCNVVNARYMRLPRLAICRFCSWTELSSAPTTTCSTRRSASSSTLFWVSKQWLVAVL